MALPINIESLLHGKAVEWERLEFKAGWAPLAVLHRMLCPQTQPFAGLGRGNATRRAIEELHAQYAFQPLHPSRHGWLRHAQFFGGAPETAQF